MTYDDSSEMLDIYRPSVDVHRLEDAHNTTREAVHETVDRVVVTPALEATANTPSISQIQGLKLATHKAVEFVVAQGQNLTNSEDSEITNMPSIQALFASYATSFPDPPKIATGGFDYVEYFDPNRMAKVRAKHKPRLEKAKQLAVSLLDHYYPEEQGYRVEPVEFPLLQLGGWRTWVYPEDCYAATKRKADNKKAGLKKNPKPVYETWGGNILADKFHRILPEHMIGYVVLSEVQHEDGSTAWAQHTYLAIMMDDLDTFEHWVPEKLMCPDKNFVSMPRADILRDSMGRQAGISNGYAILMLGPRIEFYNYKAKHPWEEKPWEYYLGPDPENDPGYDPDPTAGEETSCFSHLDGGDVDNDAWMVDIRSKPHSQTLAVVDKLFKSVASRDVEYRDGYSLPGPKI